VTIGDIRAQLAEPWEPVERAQTLGTVVAVGFLCLLKLILHDGWIPVLDHANLVFHEAGHKIYGIFGRTLGLYGGTLGQLSFPIIIAATYYWKRQAIGFVVGLVWLGENLTDVARYMASVHAEVVMLVGGTEHDWENIFARWHIVDNDDVPITRVVRLVGWLFMIVPPAWLWLRRDRRKPALESTTAR
jgi:hypothetical protein